MQLNSLIVGRSVVTYHVYSWTHLVSLKYSLVFSVYSNPFTFDGDFYEEEACYLQICVVAPIWEKSNQIRFLYYITMGQILFRLTFMFISTQAARGRFRMLLVLSQSCMHSLVFDILLLHFILLAKNINTFICTLTG